MSSEDKKVPAYTRATVNPLLSRWLTAWRATIASSISVVAPRLLIIAATGFCAANFPCCRIVLSNVSVSSSEACNCMRFTPGSP